MRGPRTGTTCADKALWVSQLVWQGAVGATIEIGQSTLQCPCHACAFFHSRDEEYELLLPFSKPARPPAKDLFQVVDKAHRDERAHASPGPGRDVDRAEREDQLEIRSWGKAHICAARASIRMRCSPSSRKSCRRAAQRGLAKTRLWANMEWAVEDFPGVHDIVEYETRLNKFLPNYDDAVICTYDLNKFSAPMVMDIMRTHPQVIIGGMGRKTRSTCRPSKFLVELAGRKTAH